MLRDIDKYFVAYTLLTLRGKR